MVSTWAPRITNSPRGSSVAPGPLADREGWAEGLPDAATIAVSAVVPLSIVRRFIPLHVIVGLPCLSSCAALLPQMRHHLGREHLHVTPGQFVGQHAKLQHGDHVVSAGGVALALDRLAHGAR